MDQTLTVIEYYLKLPEHLHFVRETEEDEEDIYFRMISAYGTGSVRILNVHRQFLVVQADFTPWKDFEKVSEIQQEYIEISQFETGSSSYKTEGNRIRHVEKGICCYANRRKAVCVICEAGMPVRFTKVIVTRDYFDQFLRNRWGDFYKSSRDGLDGLTKSPQLPRLNFVFQQIRDCPVEGKARTLYMECKVMELLSLVTYSWEQERGRRHISVKLDRRDKRSLGRAVALMKRNLAVCPSISQLAKEANMSMSRFQLAFRQVYGTTPYDYLKVMRMNHALLLLRNSDDSIRTVALKVGYKNAGHFAGLFRKTFGMGPKMYRDAHKIK